MTNKEKIKESINNDFNKEYNYNEIIKKIEGENMKNNVWKWSLVPIYLIAIIGILTFINYKNKNNDLSNQDILYTEQEKNIKLNINNIEKAGALRLDADIKEISTNGINIPWPEILKDGITIPKDLDKFNGYHIYTRKDKSSEYDTLNCTVYNYSNKNDNNYRDIRIAVSDTNKPIRDYLFSEEGSKETIINDIKLTIYKYNNIYFTEFKFKDYNFDIETENIAEEELLTLLLSIIE